MVKNIFIDTDMGYDDLVAIGMLLLCKKFQIKAISVADGITDLNKGIVNLARILTWFQKTNVPIITGTKLVRKKVPFPLDTQRTNKLSLLAKMPISKTPSRKIIISPSIESPYSSISQLEEKPILICLGPLTNIAKLIKKYGKNFTSRISRIFLMGGAIDVPGNIPPWNLAEYNTFLDPQAAKTVFATDLPITMISIDSTRLVPAMPQFAENQKIKQQLIELNQSLRRLKPNNKIKQVIREIILRNKLDFNYFYDPLAASILLNSKIIKGAFRTEIRVGLTGKNRGQTKKAMNKKPNVKVINKIDTSEFYKTLLKIITT